MNDVADSTYVRLTTFTRDERPKHTPVWIARIGDNVSGTTTDDDSWKVKRLASRPDVEVTPSDGRGRVLEDADGLTGSARLLASTHAQYAQLEAALVEKYGIRYRIFSFIRRLRRKTACGIVITSNQT